MNASKRPSFRKRLCTGQPVLGTFLKTPGVHAIEVLASTGLDFVVIDAEHAPWDRSAIDLAVLAARASALDVLVRVDGLGAIGTALDCGATGVMVPHVRSAAVAREVVAACRYRDGQRGFSNSTRAGGYGRLGLAEHVEEGDAHTTVVAMLEDPQAVDDIEAIVAVPGLDAFFLGRGDLTVALGESSTQAKAVQAAVAALARAVSAARKPLIAFVGSAAEVLALHKLGVRSFIVSSDQGLLRQAATAELTQVRQAAGLEPVFPLTWP